MDPRIVLSLAAGLLLLLTGLNQGRGTPTPIEGGSEPVAPHAPDDARPPSA
ncbi:MAG TPA: hypothetical protein VGI39_35115 [Polyangiaceae bacterium]|jgi:hypothetical protein